MEINNLSNANVVQHENNVKEAKVQPKVDMSEPVDTTEFSGSVDGEAATANKKNAKKKVDWFAVMFPTLSLLSDKKYKTEAAFFGASAGIYALTSHFSKAMQQSKINDLANYLVEPMKQKLPTAKIGLALTGVAALGVSVLHSIVANKASQESEKNNI